MRFAREGIAVGILDLDLAASEAVAAEIVAAGGKAIGLAGSVAFCWLCSEDGGYITGQTIGVNGGRIWSARA